MKVKDVLNIQGIEWVVATGTDLRTVGRAAPLYSRLIDTTTGTIFRKTGPLDTDWIEDSAAETATQGTFQPSGFADKNDSTYSYNELTREFTLNPTNQVVFVEGHKAVLNTPQSLAHADVTGSYYFYLDISGNLQVTNVWNTTLLILKNALVGFVYWNSTQQKAVIVGDERHGLMDPFTHIYLHEVFGTRWTGDGLALGDFTPGQSNSGIDDAARFSVSAGSVRDEDNLINIPDSLTTDIKRVVYRIGTEWRVKSTLDDYPVMQGALPECSGDRANYNLFSGGVWSLAEVPNRDYFCVHVVATNGGFVFVTGIGTYGNSDAAVEGASAEIAELFGPDTLPTPEATPIASVIYRTRNNASNETESYVEVQGGSALFTDWRSKFSSSRGSAVADHTELLNKDGGQYGDGGHSNLIPRVVSLVDPGPSDDVLTYKEGTIWVNSTSGAIFILMDGTEADAKWKGVDAYRGDWVTSTYYHRGDVVSRYGQEFLVLTSHVSGTNFMDNPDKVRPMASEAKLVNSAAHGLAVLDVVRYASGTWSKARANSLTTLSEPPSVVVATSTDWFLVARFGEVDDVTHGLSIGEVYFLSGATEGALTLTEPTISNPILRTTSATTFTVLSYRPVQTV